MKNLIVITTAGEFDLKPWMRPDRNYDLVLLNWGKHPLNIFESYEPGIDEFHICVGNNGPLKNIYRYFVENGLGEYDLYWFPDDDLEFTLQNEYLDFVGNVGLALSQPSMTLDSYENHDFLFHRDGQRFRTVPFVEIMCPCFSRAALERNLWTFNLNYSGYGIDMLWAKTEQPIVVDLFQIRHGRPQQMAAVAEKVGWPDPHDELEIIREGYL